jgi:hypothetical protein
MKMVVVPWIAGAEEHAEDIFAGDEALRERPQEARMNGRAAGLYGPMRLDADLERGLEGLMKARGERLALGERAKIKALDVDGVSEAVLADPIRVRRHAAAIKCAQVDDARRRSAVHLNANLFYDELEFREAIAEAAIDLRGRVEANGVAAVVDELDLWAFKGASRGDFARDGVEGVRRLSGRLGGRGGARDER